MPNKKGKKKRGGSRKTSASNSISSKSIEGKSRAYLGEQLNRIQDLLPKTNAISNKKGRKEISDILNKWKSPEAINFEEVKRVNTLITNDGSFSYDSLRLRIEPILKILDPDEVKQDTENKVFLMGVNESFRGLDLDDDDLQMILAENIDDVLFARGLRRLWVTIIRRIDNDSYSDDVKNKFLESILKLIAEPNVPVSEFLDELQKINIDKINDLNNLTEVINQFYPPLEGETIPSNLLRDIFARENEPLLEEIQKIQEKEEYITWPETIKFLDQFDVMANEIPSLTIYDLIDQTGNFDTEIATFNRMLPLKVQSKLNNHLTKKDSVGAVAVVSSPYTFTRGYTNAKNPSQWYLRDIRETLEEIKTAHKGRIHPELEERIKAKLGELVEETKIILGNNSGKDVNTIIRDNLQGSARLKEIVQNGTPGMHAEVRAANEALLTIPSHLPQQEIADLKLAVMQPRRVSKGELEASDNPDGLKEALERKQGESKACCKNCRFILSGSERYNPKNLLESDPNDWDITKITEEDG